MTVYYISPTGSDTTGSGSISNPWASVSKFLAIPPTPGDTLYCRGGDYPAIAGNRSLWTNGKSGTLGNPLTIAAYPGEAPVFHGAGDGTWFLVISDQGGATGSQHWVLDALQFEDYAPNSMGILDIYSSIPASLTGPLLVRRCKFTMPDGMTAPFDHAIYANSNTTDVTVEDCEFIALGTGGSAFQTEHENACQNFLFQRNTLSGFLTCGIYGFGTGATGAVLHNTFVNFGASSYFLRADGWAVGDVLIQDNAGDTSSLGHVYPVGTATDHCHWDQPFVGYVPATGSTAIGGAHDGTDAGAYPYLQSRGVAVL